MLSYEGQMCVFDRIRTKRENIISISIIRKTIKECKENLKVESVVSCINS